MDSLEIPITIVLVGGEEGSLNFLDKEVFVNIITIVVVAGLSSTLKGLASSALSSSSSKSTSSGSSSG